MVSWLVSDRSVVTRCSSEDGGEHLPAKALKRGLMLMTLPPEVYLVFHFLAERHEHSHLLMLSICIPKGRDLNM